jgi:hypothetical protein
VKYPLGAWALPGAYSAKLTVDGKSYSAAFTVKMDPRITISLADLRKQFEMQSGSVEGMNESFEALSQVQSVRAQLKERAAKAGKGALADAITALDKQAADLEGATQSRFFGLPPGSKPAENFSSLNQHFGNVLGIADSADAAPTTQATAVYKELEDALEKRISQWAKIRQQGIPALNAELKKAGLAPVDPNKASETAPSEDRSYNGEESVCCGESRIRNGRQSRRLVRLGRLLQFPQIVEDFSTVFIGIYVEVGLSNGAGGVDEKSVASGKFGEAEI